MKKTLLLAGIMLMTRFLTANADVDPNFYVYLCFGQSNMEGNAAIEAQDKEYVDPRFKTLACVDFQDPRRNKGEWYTAYPPIVRQGTGLGMADYFGRTMVANLPNEITVGVVDGVAIGGSPKRCLTKTNTSRKRWAKYDKGKAHWFKNIMANMYNNDHPIRQTYRDGKESSGD